MTAARCSPGRHAVGWRDAARASRPEVSNLDSPTPSSCAQQILELPEDSLLRAAGLRLVSCSIKHVQLRRHRRRLALRDPGHPGSLAAGGPSSLSAPSSTSRPALANDVTTDWLSRCPMMRAIDASRCASLSARGTTFDDGVPAADRGSACRGMTQQQVEDRVALALRKFKALNGDAAKLILHEKAEVHASQRAAASTTEPPSRWPGPDRRLRCNVKQHIRRDKACFSDEASAFGIDPPRGLLLVGVPGCGKTAISLSAAAELGMPLIQFDVGALMSKWVGETESNCRTALAQIEAMAPCVVQMDEIEKGFGGVGRDGDSGAGMRAFGTVLKWMSERTCPAYVIMTANNVQALPPEFTRKGRIDEVFGVYLPEADERSEIFSIHLRKRNRDPELFDLEGLADATDGYTGADIDQVVITALKLAFHAGGELSTEHLLAAAPEVRPLSQTDPERVAQITEWLERHTTRANGKNGVSNEAIKRARPVAV
jgi:hypothetical protein